MALEPFTLAASMEFAPDDGQPNATLDFAFSGQFEHRQTQKLEISGAGTHVVGFGTIAAPGAKAIFLEYLNNAGSGLAPVNLRFNGGTDDVEVSAGGCFYYCNPTASSGITSLSIVTTSGCTIRVTLLQ